MTIPLQKCKGNRLKFQYNNVMALLKSPDQMAKNIDISKNSAGWADQQVALQYETLDRQLKALTADYQQLLRILNQAGAINGLTDIVKAIRELVQLLQHVDVKNIQMLGNTLKTWILFKSALFMVSAAANSAQAMLTNLNISGRITGNTFDRLSAKVTVFSASLRTLSLAAGWIGLIVTALQLAYSAYEAYQDKQKEAVEAEKNQVANLQASSEAYNQKAQSLTSLADQLDAATAKTKDYTLSEQDSKAASEDVVSIKNKILDMLPEESRKKIIAANFSREAINTEINALNSLQQASYQNAVIYAQHQADKTNALAAETQKRLELYQAEAEVLAGMGEAISNIQLPDGMGWLQNRMDTVKEKASAEVETQIEVNKNVVSELTQKGLKLKEQAAKQQRAADALANKVRNTSGGKYGVTAPNEAPLSNDTGNGGTGKGGSGGNGGSGSNADDMAAKAERLKWQREQNSLMYDAKVSATEYDTALKKLNNTEDIEGVTAETSSKKYELYVKRISEITSYKSKLEDFKKTLMTTLDTKMKENPEIAKQLGYTSNMTDKEKERLLNINKETIQEMKTFVEISKIIGEVNTKIAEADGKLEDVNHTLAKTKLSMKSDDVYTRITETAKAEYDAAAYRRAGYNDIYEEQKNYQDKIDYLTIVYIASMNKMEAKRAEFAQISKSSNEQDVYNAKKALDQAVADAEKANSELRQAKLDSTTKIREGMADVTTQLIVQGNSWHDIWKSLWQDFMKEAIYSMFKVKTEASLLGGILQALGLFGGFGGNSFAGVGSYSFTPTMAFSSHMGSSVGSYPKMHSGGEVASPNGVVPQLKNDEVVRTLQVGEEVNSMSERRSNEILGAVAMKAIDAKSQTPTQVQIVALDTRSFAQYMNDNSDVLLAVLAKNKALGRSV